MTGTVHDITNPAHRIDQLLHLLSQKEEEIQVLKTVDNGVLQLDVQHSFKTVPGLNEFQDMMVQIKESLSQIELDYSCLRKDWESFSHTIQEQIDRIETTYQRTHDQYEAINQARLKVIQEQKRALAAYRLTHIKYHVKNFFRPRIGVLYQHEPRIFTIPKRYKKTVALKNTPTISIVTPSFNQGNFLEKTILSVTEQKYPALEYVIQDGASKDDTLEVIKRYQSSLKRWESKADEGQSHALNLGFQHTTGEIMAYLNSDDILLPGTLHYVANYFNTHPDVDVVYGHRILIDDDDREVGRWVLPPHNSTVLTWADFIPQETLFWRRRIWDKVGGNIDENFKFAMDWDLLLRFKEAGATFVRLPRFLGAFRVHQHQKTSAQIAEIGMKEMERLRIRCHGRRVTHVEVKKHILSYIVKHILFHKLYRIGILRY